MTKALFWIVFALVLCVGGALAFAGVPFRPVLATPLPFLLVPFFGIRVNRATLAMFGLAIVIILSGLVNNSSTSDVLKFFRFVTTPFAMYYLASIFMNTKRAESVFRALLLLGMAQLPIVLIQRLGSDRLAPLSAVAVGETDFQFGTFYVAGDTDMSFFLLGLTAFLLFDRQHNHFVNRRFISVACFSVTILLANSKMVQILLIALWVAFVLLRLRHKVVLRAVPAAAAIIVVAWWFGYQETLVEEVLPSVSISTLRKQADDPRAQEDFLTGGGYARSAAVAYYFDQPLKYLGDGPSRYFDPALRRYAMANQGQVFTFYSEVGILGLIASYLVLAAITLSGPGISKAVAVPLFLSASALTLTTSVMSTASIMLVISLIARAGFLPTVSPSAVRPNGMEPGVNLDLPQLGRGP